MKTMYSQLATYRISDTTVRDLGGPMSAELSMWVIPDVILYTLSDVVLAKRYDYTHSSSYTYDLLKTCIENSIGNLNIVVDTMGKHNRDALALNAYSDFIDGFNSDIKKLTAYLIPRMMDYLTGLIGELPIELTAGHVPHVCRCRYNGFYEFRVVQYEARNKNRSLSE